MINVPNECKLQIGLGVADDIVADTTPVELEIKEQIGNLLPSALMTLAVDPNEVMSYLATEHAPVTINLGYHEDVEAFSKWQICGFEEYDDKIIFMLTIDRSYVNKSAYKVYKSQQSCDVIEKVVSEYFVTKAPMDRSPSRIKPMDDAMTWIQHGNSMRDFVNEVWLHSWAGSKLMMPVISAFKTSKSDKAGTFKLIDMSDTSRAIEVVKHAKTMEETVKDGKIWMVGAGMYSSNSGPYNTEIGDRKHSTFDAKESKVVTEKIVPEPIFQGDFNMLNIKVHNDPMCFACGDNVHKHYAEAKASNVSRLSKFSGNAKRVVVVDYGKITIGDVVLITIPIHGTTTPNDIQSGKYIVSEIKHTITSKGIVKTYVKELTLRRDANLVLEHEKFVKGE